MVAGCDGSKVAATGGPFDPIQFFAGHTRGDATLRLITGSSHRVSVDSHGIADGHGGLILDQAIREEGKQPRTRRWNLHPAGANRWAGTLTDAKGPVVVERTSADVTIRYSMPNGAKVEQHLRRSPGGPVDNHLTVSRIGLRLATLEEQIRKVS
jgi:hypothetical protein